MKKTIIYILSVIMILTTFSGCNGASEDPKKESESKEEAATEKENPITDFEYEDNEDGGISITNYVGTSTEVVIPSKINGKDVTEISYDAFMGNTSITYVRVPDTVSIINSCAFQKCTSLKKVILSNSLTTIGGVAFADCTSLSEIILPSSLTIIRQEAFANCTSLKHINIPAGLTDCYMAFKNSGLETVKIENGTEEILYMMFASASNLKEVELPETVKTIDNGAFGECYNLEKVILNEGLIKIDKSVFSRCTSLTEIVIPSTVEVVSEISFLGCDNLEKIKFSGNAPENYLTTEPHDHFTSSFPEYTICYHEGAQGFTSPEWNGYKTEIW